MPTARLSVTTLAPQAVAALASVNQAVAECGVEASLIELVKLRVSQLNGCAYCVDLHWRDLIAHGEDAQKLNSLVTWHEVPFFSPRERAALAWAESLTELTRSHVSDADFDAVRAQFTDAEVVTLAFAVATMNAWNRLGVAFRLPVLKTGLPKAKAPVTPAPAASPA